MIEYFKLQITLQKRKISDFGLPPYIGGLIGVVLFIICSLLLFEKTVYAPHIYSMIAFSSIFSLGKVKRNDFLKQIFSTNEFIKIRIIENVLLYLPFFLFLIYKGDYYFAVVFLLISVVLSFISRKERFFITIPTPFGKKPFEFAIGFRKTFFIFIAILFILFMAIKVNNFNLGAFCLLSIFLVSMSYYGFSEKEQFIWIYNSNSKDFLKEKIFTALKHTSILSTPILIILMLSFPDKTPFILLIQGVGYLYLIAIILGKYSAYPSMMSLPQAFFLGISLWLPPLLLVVIPFFYKKAIKQLDQILI